MNYSYVKQSGTAYEFLSDKGHEYNDVVYGSQYLASCTDDFLASIGVYRTVLLPTPDGAKQSDGTMYFNKVGNIVEYRPNYIMKTQAELQYDLKDHFKSMYLAHVDTKLKELDYDSLATVKLWEGDATFGAEASRILTWYKAIIAMNYALITNVSTGVAQVPTDAEYQTMLDGVVF